MNNSRFWGATWGGQMNISLLWGPPRVRGREWDGGEGGVLPMEGPASAAPCQHGSRPDRTRSGPRPDPDRPRTGCSTQVRILPAHCQPGSGPDGTALRAGAPMAPIVPSTSWQVRHQIPTAGLSAAGSGQMPRPCANLPADPFHNLQGPRQPNRPSALPIATKRWVLPGLHASSAQRRLRRAHSGHASVPRGHQLPKRLVKKALGVDLLALPPPSNASCPSSKPSSRTLSCNITSPFHRYEIHPTCRHESSDLALPGLAYHLTDIHSTMVDTGRGWSRCRRHVVIRHHSLIQGRWLTTKGKFGRHFVDISPTFSRQQSSPQGR